MGSNIGCPMHLDIFGVSNGTFNMKGHMITTRNSQNHFRSFIWNDMINVRTLRAMIVGIL